MTSNGTMTAKGVISWDAEKQLLDVAPVEWSRGINFDASDLGYVRKHHSLLCFGDFSEVQSVCSSATLFIMWSQNRSTHAQVETLHTVTPSKLFSHLFFVFSVFLLIVEVLWIGCNDSIKFVCFYIYDVLQIVLDIEIKNFR